MVCRLPTEPRPSIPVPGAGVEPTSAGSEPDVLPVRRPRSHCLLEPTSLDKVRGEGVEPSSPGSKPGSLPLADPRECPVGIEPTSLVWKTSAFAARPRAQLAEGEGVEPSRLIARPFSRRLPSPFGLPFRFNPYEAWSGFTFSDREMLSIVMWSVR